MTAPDARRKSIPRIPPSSNPESSSPTSTSKSSIPWGAHRESIDATNEHVLTAADTTQHAQAVAAIQKHSNVPREIGVDDGADRARVEQDIGQLDRGSPRSPATGRGRRRECRTRASSGSYQRGLIGPVCRLSRWHLVARIARRRRANADRTGARVGGSAGNECMIAKHLRVQVSGVTNRFPCTSAGSVGSWYVSARLFQCSSSGA